MLRTKVAVAAVLLAAYVVLLAFWALLPERGLTFLTVDQLLNLVVVTGPSSYIQPALSESWRAAEWTFYFAAGTAACFTGILGALFLRDTGLRFLFAAMAAWTWFWCGLLHAAWRFT